MWNQPNQKPMEKMTLHSATVAALPDPTLAIALQAIYKKALLAAVSVGCAASVKLLLDAFASIRQSKPSRVSRDPWRLGIKSVEVDPRDFKSAAASKGTAATAGRDPEKRRAKTPLQLACAHGNREITQLLLAAGTNANDGCVLTSFASHLIANDQVCNHCILMQ